MSQPKWKCIGHIGDMDPIAHGGGFVYVDETGVYDPYLAWFEPGPDEQWHELEGETPLQVYRIILEPGLSAFAEWWFDKLPEVARTCGQDLSQLRQDSINADPMVRALVYWDLIGYFGPDAFDSYPVTMTEDETYEQFKNEMEVSRK